MAAAQPAKSFFTLGECVKVTIDGLSGYGETDDEVKKLVYQTCTESGTNITAPASIIPIDGKTLNFDLNADIKGILFTEPPNCGAAFGASRSEDSMKDDFVFKCWDVTFNKETCETTEGAEQDSPPFTVVNSSNSPFANDVTPSILNCFPKNNYICRDTDFFIYACNSSGSFTTTFHNWDGSTVGGPSISISAGSTVVSVQANPKPPSTVRSVYIAGLDIWLHYENCCCEEDQYDVYFQNIYGGYDVVSFDCTLGESVKTSFTEICTYRDCIAPSDPMAYAKGGVSIESKKSRRQFILDKCFPFTAYDNREFLNQFLSSGSYFIKIKPKGGGDPYLVKFAANSSTAKIVERDKDTTFKVTGYAMEYFNHPNHRI